MEAFRNQAPGSPVRNVADLLDWLKANGIVRGRELTEHVACANGRTVNSAGEMTFAVAGAIARIITVTNQSTGYCPEPASWPEVQRSLDALGIADVGADRKAPNRARMPGWSFSRFAGGSADVLVHSSRCDELHSLLGRLRRQRDRRSRSDDWRRHHHADQQQHAD